MENFVTPPLPHSIEKSWLLLQKNNYQPGLHAGDEICWCRNMTNINGQITLYTNSLALICLSILVSSFLCENGLDRKSMSMLDANPVANPQVIFSSLIALVHQTYHQEFQL